MYRRWSPTPAIPKVDNSPFEVLESHNISKNDTVRYRVACGELQDRLARGPFGIVVESAGHVLVDPESGEMVLAGGSATFDGPTPVGRYFSYRLTNISCEE